MKAALSNKEYQIITECAISNISETPHVIPPLGHQSVSYSDNMPEPTVPEHPDGLESQNATGEAWIVTKVSVDITLVELCLHTAVARDTTLATVQVFSF